MSQVIVELPDATWRRKRVNAELERHLILRLARPPYHVQARVARRRALFSFLLGACLVLIFTAGALLDGRAQRDSRPPAAAGVSR